MRPLRGLVLAAGLGQRLQPLTNFYAKPALPWAGTNALTLALGRLRRAGITDVAVNAHYRAEDIRKIVASNPYDQNLHLAFEPKILGTGGVYNQLRQWFGPADVLAINGDIISDLPLETVVDLHRRSGAALTLQILDTVTPGESAVWHKDERVQSIGHAGSEGSRAGTFACVQVVGQDMLALLAGPGPGVRTGFVDMKIEGYLRGLERGLHIAANVQQGFWHDLRTPRFYWESLLALLGSPRIPARLYLNDARERMGRQFLDVVTTEGVAATGPVLFERSTRFAAGARVGPFVVIEGPGISIPAGVNICNAILLPGARLALGSQVRDAIVFEGGQLSVAD